MSGEDSSMFESMEAEPKNEISSEESSPVTKSTDLLEGLISKLNSPNSAFAPNPVLGNYTHTHTFHYSNTEMSL
jgi:hypothetical protein